MNKPIADIAHPKMLLDHYAAWAVKEGVPITEDLGVDLLEVPTAPWPRFGIDGGLVHLKGRGDFVSIFVLELAPGAKSAPQKHLFEEVIYVLSGHGNTTIETSDGRKHSFEWGPKSLFALPLNARYQHFNSSGRERARLASTNNLALMLNLFHNETFVFDNGYDFPERQGAAKYFSGEGEFIPVRPGRNMWETNFVPDLAGFELKAWEQRGAGGSNMMFILADRTMHAHTSRGWRSAPTRRRIGTALISTSSPSPGTASRCCGTTAQRTSCVSIGSTAGCSRRRTRCSTSTSTQRAIPRATSPLPSAACATRSPPTSAASSWAWT